MITTDFWTFKESFRPLSKILTFLKDEQVKSSQWLLTKVFAMFADSKKTLLKKSLPSHSGIQLVAGSWQQKPPSRQLRSSTRILHQQVPARIAIFSWCKFLVKGGILDQLRGPSCAILREPYFVHLSHNCLCKLPVKSQCWSTGRDVDAAVWHWRGSCADRSLQRSPASRADDTRSGWRGQRCSLEKWSELALVTWGWKNMAATLSPLHYIIYITSHPITLHEDGRIWQAPCPRYIT